MKKSKSIFRDVSITVPMSEEEKNKVQEKANEWALQCHLLLELL